MDAELLAHQFRAACSVKEIANRIDKETKGKLSNGMTLMNLDEYWQWVAKGAVLLFAVAFDNMQRRRKAKT